MQSNNVTQYATALIPVPDKCGATKFVFEIPVIKKKWIRQMCFLH